MKKVQILLNFWNTLSHISAVKIPRGKGEVMATKVSPAVICLEEKGAWESETKQTFQFTNKTRWTLKEKEGVISLEHLRRGTNHPVFLVNFVPESTRSLHSTSPHLCNEDAYFGHVLFDVRTFHLRWRIIGPKKNGQLDYYYEDNFFTWIFRGTTGF